VWFDASAPNRKLFSEEGHARAVVLGDSRVVGANLTPTRRSVPFLSFFWTFEVKLLFAYFVLVLWLPI
jgi:hypothetical protein